MTGMLREQHPDFIFNDLKYFGAGKILSKIKCKIVFWKRGSGEDLFPQRTSPVNKDGINVKKDHRKYQRIQDALDLDIYLYRA